jgi:hypothetical protein
MKIIVQKLRGIAVCAVMLSSTIVFISAKNKLPVENISNLSDNKGVVLLELFTSQGCSSCPPADALLAEYASAHNERIIPLSFHVDYWNRLGWADPFSNKIFSERQYWYSEHLPKGSVYTPQLILNGEKEVVGNNRKSVNSLVQQELMAQHKETIEVNDISIDKNAVHFHYRSTNINKDQQLNIALVQKQATTPIKAGENDGVTITNHNIVRSFVTKELHSNGEGSVSIPATFKPAEYALVVYIQNKNDLSIATALMKELQ